VYVTSLRLEGLSAAEAVDLQLPLPVASLPSGAAGLAALDAFDLFIAACDPARTAAALARLGVVTPGAAVDVTVEDGLPSQASFDRGDAGGLLAPGGARTLKVRLDLALDPVLFGTLREWAMRDPRLVTALGDATASVTAGWAFTNDLSTAAIGRLHVRIGEAVIPSVGAERPRWLSGWLRDVAARFHRVPDDDLGALAARVHAAALSADPELRGRARRLASAVAEPPLSLGQLELVELATGLAPCFGPDLLRARLIGRRGADRLRVAAAAILAQPDVLLLERTDAIDDGMLSWLTSLTEGDDAVLEQIVLAPGLP
jgi:hypothetical protein